MLPKDRVTSEILKNHFKIDGDEKYKDLMKRLSPPYHRQGPPFDNPLGEIKWDYEQFQRKLRRARGLPSTPDIETIQNMLSNLYNLALTATDEPLLYNFVASIPSLPNLVFADFEEAAQNVNLTRLNSYKYFGPLRQVNAAYAGTGLGLCKHWGDVLKCDEEEQLMSPTQVLTISYTKEELVLEASYAVNAHWIYGEAYQRYTEYGFSHLQEYKSADFWDQIEKRITTLVKANGMKVGELLLIGESAEEKEFLETVWRALGKLELGHLWAPLQVPGFKAEFMAARGSAEMAKRWQGEPYGCLEGDWCEGNRKPGDDAMEEET
ncbi:hypothetical protein G7Y89_g3388 [Cudoniella acicularis]|uniref:Uncharacterized protein n=1 Tax=Cudoniella acicularis TaxID=354080 RepID=A0A8H4W5M8_9HELO|nr:hypothetical protein G7Y89_g3388 [Cudoniella acicularis]